jgi:hypothetical protein
MLLLGLAISSARAQSTIEISSTNNGGDLHEGSYGEMYSTIGEPVASDSASTVDDKATWTGFWQVMPIGGISGGVHEEAQAWAASSTAIASVAPDPFTTELEVKVTLAHGADVRLVMFDMLGRPVGALIDGHREAGTLRVVWTPEDLGSGSYVLQLVVDGESYGSRLLHYYR